MSASYPLISSEALPRGERARIAFCGAPMTLHRRSGDSAAASYRCKSKYCSTCRPKYAARVGYCIEERLEDRPVWMLTLTQPKGPRGHNTRADLRGALARHRAIWMRATSILRWAAYHASRGRHVLEPPGRPNPHPGYSRTWNAEALCWREPVQADGYLWALEVTPGKDGRWHVHRHVMCSSQSMAERINAAWQQAAQELRAVPAGQWTRTDIRCIPAKRAAYYIAQYVSRKSETKNLRGKPLVAYVRETRKIRRYDAGGAFRPLGIGNHAERTDPVEEISLCWYAADLMPPDYQLRVPVGDVFKAKNLEIFVGDAVRTGVLRQSGIMSRRGWNPMAIRDPEEHTCALPPPD